MAEDRFNVVTFDDEGYSRYVHRDLADAEDAVLWARILVDEAIAHGGISRVMITDQDDFTNFLWQRGKGIIVPGSAWVFVRWM